jgi:hypothetical protein
MRLQAQKAQACEPAFIYIPTTGSYVSYMLLNSSVCVHNPTTCQEFGVFIIPACILCQALGLDNHASF